MYSYKYSQNICNSELVVKDNQNLSVKKMRPCSMSILRDIQNNMVHVHVNRKTENTTCSMPILTNVKNTLCCMSVLTT